MSGSGGISICERSWASVQLYPNRECHETGNAARTISVKSEWQCGHVRPSSCDQTPSQEWQYMRLPVSAMAQRRSQMKEL